MVKEFRTTLDIDTNDKDFRLRVFLKIERCKNLVYMTTKESGLKGFHFILFCKIKCDICRMVYDDPRRFAYDQFRPEYAQNILFDTKVLLIDYVKNVVSKRVKNVTF